MAAQPLTMMRCERCRAIVSSAHALTMIRQGIPCGVCGGTLTASAQTGRATDERPLVVSASAER